MKQIKNMLWYGWRIEAGNKFNRSPKTIDHWLKDEVPELMNWLADEIVLRHLAELEIKERIDLLVKSINKQNEKAN